MTTPTTEEEKIEMVISFIQRRGVVIPPSLPAAKLYCMLSAVQLACRHPNFTGSAREHAEEMANELAKALFRDDAAMKQLWEQGWQQQFDC